MIRNFTFNNKLTSSITYLFVSSHYRIGDYHRYRIEIFSQPEREIFILHALQSYDIAETMALIHLPASNPSRIFIALHQSILLAHSLRMKHTALTIAQNAYTAAMNDAINTPKNARVKLGFNNIMHVLSGNIVTLRFDVTHHLIDPILPPLDDFQRRQARTNLIKDGILR